MKSLIALRLFCNPKKCDFFLTEMDFLGHHISARGIKPNKSKIQKILDWPVPMNLTEVQAFLGLVWYIAAFLPKLMDHMLLLTPLTNKMAKSDFSWTGDHQLAFESIKALVISADCSPSLTIQILEKTKSFCHLWCKQLAYRSLPDIWRNLGNHPPCCIRFNATWSCRKKLSDSWKRAPCHHQSTKEVVLQPLRCGVHCVYWPSHTWKLQHPTWLIKVPTLMARVYVAVQDGYCIHPRWGQLHHRCFVPCSRRGLPWWGNK